MRTMPSIDIHNKKHVVYMCLTLAFTIGIIVIILTCMTKSKVSHNKSACATQPVTTKKSTTVETTTTTKESTTKKETTTKKKPPAAPITKKYVRKKKRKVVKRKPSNKVMLKVPYVSQLPSYPTGCEAASATMLLKFYGYNVSLSQVVNAIPREDLYKENGKVYGPSIKRKFVGNPRQRYTDPRPGYGAFAPVVTSSINSIVRNRKGNRVAKNITGCSFNTLLNYNKKGYPVIVWATYRMKIPTLVNAWYIKNANGTDTYFEYPRGTHVMVLVGHDSNRVYINDPYRRGIQSYSISTFADRWDLLGNQAIVMEQRVEKTTKPTTTVTTTKTTTTKSTTTEATTESTSSDKTTTTTSNPDVSDTTSN